MYHAYLGCIWRFGKGSAKIFSKSCGVLEIPSFYGALRKGVTLSARGNGREVFHGLRQGQHSGMTCLPTKVPRVTRSCISAQAKAQS